MKIATLTYQRHDNYGAMLQCYALQKKIQSFGYETDVIDYVCRITEYPFSLQALKEKGIKRYITGNIGAITRLPRAKKFRKFRENLKISKTITKDNASLLGVEYDGYIVGSDNVWNTDIHGFDENYFLSFVADKRKRVSYAASFGSSSIEETQKERYSKLLCDFAIVNTREYSGAKLVKELTGKEANVVCDPSLLLTEEEWASIAKDVPIASKYLLAYQMVPSYSFVRYVRKVAKEKKLKVVYIPFPYGIIRCKPMLSIGPLEWLGLFKNAEYILTDSFHGCAFSIIFRKQFAIRISQLGERITNLLSIVGLSNRVAYTAKQVNSMTEIDYDKVSEKLDVFRNASEDKLTAILTYFKSISGEYKNGITDPSRCTGCQLCRVICPKNAIDLQIDSLGFLYPKINSKLCIGCHACENICNKLSLNKLTVDRTLRKYYSAVNLNADVVKKSGSGGMFFALAEAIINRKGVVFGAAYDANYAIVHESVKNHEEIVRIMGTKYTQSNIYNLYRVVNEETKVGTPTLFVGTPCQCAAIKEYVKLKHGNLNCLYIVDIFCHGVFSPTMWSEYINILEKRFGKIMFISFRDKSKGWRNKHLKILTEEMDISVYCNKHASVLRLYEQNISLRESCYQCQYMSLERVGDLSIGDFWGIERVAPKLDRNTGISAVIVSSEKGDKLLKYTLEKIELNEFEEKNIIQQVLKGFTKKHSERSLFINSYKLSGMKGVLEEYGQVVGKLRLKRDFIIPFLYRFRLAGLASRILHMNDN